MALLAAKTEPISLPCRTGGSPRLPSDEVASLAICVPSSVDWSVGPWVLVDRSRKWRSRRDPGHCSRSQLKFGRQAVLVDHGDICLRDQASVRSPRHLCEAQSSTIPRLLRLSVRNTGESSSSEGAHPRDRSPCGGSILITSAPASPRDMAVYGPATPSAISRTRISLERSRHG